MCRVLFYAIDVGVERRSVCMPAAQKLPDIVSDVGSGVCRVEVMTSQSQLVKRVAVSVWAAKVSESLAEKLRMQDWGGYQRA